MAPTCQRAALQHCAASPRTARNLHKHPAHTHASAIAGGTRGARGIASARPQDTRRQRKLGTAPTCQRAALQHCAASPRTARNLHKHPAHTHASAIAGGTRGTRGIASARPRDTRRRRELGTAPTCQHATLQHCAASPRTVRILQRHPAHSPGGHTSSWLGEAELNPQPRLGKAERCRWRRRYLPLAPAGSSLVLRGGAGAATRGQRECLPG